MRDLIDAAERAVAGATPGEWSCGPWGDGSSSDGFANIYLHSIEQVITDALIEDCEHIVTLHNLSLHPDFFPALKLFADLKAGDPALVERISNTITNAPGDGDARAVMQALVR